MSPRAVAAAAAQTAYHFKPKEPVEYYYFFFMCQHWYYYGRTPHIIYADAILHYAHCDITYLFMFRTDFRETNGKNEKTHKTKRISAKFVSHTYQYRILISFVLDVCVSCHLGSFSSYVLFPALFAVLLCTLSLVRSYEEHIKVLNDDVLYRKWEMCGACVYAQCVMCMRVMCMQL